MTMLKCRTNDIQRAEDIHQETFCIVLLRLRDKGIDDPTKIANFIHKTAINVLIGQQRKEARRQTYPDTELIDQQKDQRSDQLSQLIRREADGAIRGSIAELKTERDRQILYRFYVLQQEKSLVCSALDLSAEHFDRVIARARKRFREHIERKQDNVVELGDLR